MEDLQTALAFIEGVKHAKLDDSKLDPEVIKRLRNPIEAPLEIEDEDKLFSMKLFSVTAGSSQATYKEVREAILDRHPEDPILSYEQAKKAVQDNSGVVHVWMTCAQYLALHTLDLTVVWKNAQVWIRQI